VEEGLHRQLGGLFGGEARPVVEAGFGLEVGGPERGVGLVPPPPKLLIVQRNLTQGWLIIGRGFALTDTLSSIA
jgi:hypothetical protein